MPRPTSAEPSRSGDRVRSRFRVGPVDGSFVGSVGDFVRRYACRFRPTENISSVAETGAAVLERRDEVTGFEIVSDPGAPELRHFSATLEPLCTETATAVDGGSE